MHRRLPWLVFTILLIPATLDAQTYYSPRVEAPVAMARFGGALAIGDGEVLVGESQNRYRSGFVHVYRKGASGWEQAARITAPGAEWSDGFGAALALDGATMLVSATNQNEGRGVIHIFRKASGGDWESAGAFDAPGITEDDGFGASVALSGDWAFVGAPGTNEGMGAVHLFRRAANGAFAPAALLEPVNGQPGGQFGTSVAAADGQLLVGAPAGSGGGGRGRGRGGRGRGGRGGRGLQVQQLPASGMIHAYTLAGNIWQPTGQVAVEESGAQFGRTVAIDGDRALVGAPGQGDAGTVFQLNRGAGGQWTVAGQVAATDAGENAQFGSAVALNGDEAWFGAPGTSDDAGAAFVARQQGSTFGNLTRLTSSTGSDFGSTVAARGNLGAVGVLGAAYGEGAVVIYERSGSAWSEADVVQGEPDELPVVTGGEIRCSADGNVQVYECGDVELLSFLPPSKLTADGHSNTGMSDIWGWTDPETNREYVISGRRDGTAFVDITDPVNPLLIGDLPMTPGARSSSWRDMKTYKDHVFIVSDGAGEHGMQVFDLTRLRNVQNPPVVFEPDELYTSINSAHNIVINEESGFAYIVGAGGGGETCGGGSHIVNIQDPKSPVFAGCFEHTGTSGSDRGYTHDAQCVVYSGPDTRYTGHEICIGLNARSISVADLTDKQDGQPLAIATYPEYGYVHQGWFTEDHRYFYVGDESDETGEGGPVPFTRTMVYDMTNLEDPRLVKEYYGPERTFDHNLYVRGNLMYQANYKSGLRILDISDPVNPVEVGHFDTYPLGENNTGFSGAWSVYPYFPSGTIVINSMGEGLFMLRKRARVIS